MEECQGAAARRSVPPRRGARRKSRGKGEKEKGGGTPASVLGVRAGKCRGSAAPPRVGLTPVCRRLAEAAAGSGGLLEGVKTQKSLGTNAVLRYRRCHGSRAPECSGGSGSCPQVESSRTEQVLREVEALLGHSYSSSTPSSCACGWCIWVKRLINAKMWRARSRARESCGAGRRYIKIYEQSRV